jgi:hypothetical protein
MPGRQSAKAVEVAQGALRLVIEQRYRAVGEALQEEITIIG